MSDGKEKKFVLKIPDPIEINTTGAGRILFTHWTVGAIQNVSEILSRKAESPAAFVREFASKLGRVPSPEKESLREQYDHGAKFVAQNQLTDDDIELIASEYLGRLQDEMLYWRSSGKEEVTESLDRKKDEKSSEYFLRITTLCVKKEEERARELFKKFNFLGASSELFESLKRNQVQLGLVSQRIKQIASIPTLPAFESHTFEVPAIPTNPTYESNRLLGSQLEELRTLIQLIQAQSEQAELLNNKTELLLSAAAQSGKQTKIGIWVAALGIILSAGLGMYSLVETNNSGAESTRLQEETNKVLSQINNRLVQSPIQKRPAAPKENARETRGVGAKGEVKGAPIK